MKVIFVHSRGWAPAPRQQEGETMDQKASAKVLVLDFGAQYGQKFATVGPEFIEYLTAKKDA